jgi:hypothetical protein
MEGSLIVSIAALVISVLSLGVSSILTFRQVRLLRSANHLPVIIDLLGEFRKSEFHQKYRSIIENLRADHDPDHGLSGLPDDARDTVLDIAYYFQTFAILDSHDVLRNRQMYTHLNYRTIEVWTAIEPFMRTQRRSPSGAERWMLLQLETYAEKLKQQSATTL